MNQKLKDQLRISGRTIGVSLLIYAVILIARLHYLGVLLLFTALTILTHSKNILKNYRARSVYFALLKSLLKMYLIITIIYFLSWLLGPWGFFGTLLIILLLAAYRIFTSWQEFVNGLRDIETQIWGRPLDRKEWQNHKPPKLRLVFKKRQNVTGETMKKKQKQKIIRPLHPALCWISLAAFVIIGGLAITDNLIAAIFALYGGVGIGYFIGYLMGVFVIVVLVYLIPIVMISKYIRYARRHYEK